MERITTGIRAKTDFTSIVKQVILATLINYNIFKLEVI